MKVLFWNTHNNQNINYVLHDLIIENNISLAFLAEYKDNIDELKNELYNNGISMFHYPSIGCERISVLGKQMNISQGLQTRHSSFQIVNNKDIYCCIHLPSKIYGDTEGKRKVIINTIVSDIESVEKKLNSNNTIIVGDFNINPFESGCLDALGFHGIPIYDVAAREKRTIEEKEFKMFYNPMWRFFGDDKKPYGTFYYSDNNTSNVFWHILDQVIIRPSLRNRFVDSNLRIITETENYYLLNKQGHPDKNISDHLPIIFEIQEESNGIKS